MQQAPSGALRAREAAGRGTAERSPRPGSAKTQFLFPVPERARNGGTALKRHKRLAKLGSAVPPSRFKPAAAALPPLPRGAGGLRGSGCCPPAVVRLVLRSPRSAIASLLTPCCLYHRVLGCVQETRVQM